PEALVFWHAQRRTRGLLPKPVHDVRREARVHGRDPVRVDERTARLPLLGRARREGDLRGVPRRPRWDDGDLEHAATRREGSRGWHPPREVRGDAADVDVPPRLRDRPPRYDRRQGPAGHETRSVGPSGPDRPQPLGPRRSDPHPRLPERLLW